jgi:hypothetical protein
MPRAFDSALLGSIFSGLAVVHEMKNAVEEWMLGFAELGKNFIVIGKVSSYCSYIHQIRAVSFFTMKLIPHRLID